MSNLKLIFSFLFILNFQLSIAQQHLSGQDSLISVKDSSIIVEKVYLQTDRDYYSQGDNIWFKAYLVEDPNLFLSYNSMNLHVGSSSSQSEIVESRIIRIEGGLGKGDIRLSEDSDPRCLHYQGLHQLYAELH